ncbi:hypothetical protein ACFPAG_16360 [Vogesella sp. GCM10023246]|uniref:Uncharacterized protein n=1 Tax=Vogesella oryzagri TaxID=3160864 RepID=A0ABV1MA02_9NEIS
MFVIDDLILLAIHAATIQVQFLGGIPAPDQGQLAQVAVKPIVSMFSQYRECIYEGVVVPYSNQTPTTQDKSTNNQANQSVDGRALLVYKRQCPGKAPEKLFLAGEAKSIPGNTGKDTVFVKEFNPADTKEPTWMAQVINTLNHSDSAVATEFRRYANEIKPESDNARSPESQPSNKQTTQEEEKQK